MKDLLQNYREYTINSQGQKIVFFFNSGFCIDRPPKNPFYMHSHYHSEIFTVLKGEMGIVTEDGITELSPGETVLIPANTPHKPVYGKDIFRVNIAFLNPENNTSPLTKKLSELSSSREILIYKNPLFTEVVKHILEYENGEYEFKALLIEACLSELAILICQNDASAGEGTKRFTDSKSYRYYVIAEIFRSGFAPGAVTVKVPTLKEVSEQLHLSEKQTERLVKKFFGRSFREEVLHMKMKKAAELLEKTDLSVNEIASATGYSVTRSFYASFYKTFGKTPSEYRKEKTDLQ